MLLKGNLPSVTDIHNEVKARFGFEPCLFQLEDALAQLRGDDCITTAATGSGKTLTFWIPLLFVQGIMILITALNILGDQNVAELTSLGINAVNVTAENASDALFQDIASGVYRVIIVSPEKILTDPQFQALWTNRKFLKQVFNISCDEGHCISQWGSTFRPEYGQLGRLRWILPSHIQFHLVSATVPQSILQDIKEKLHMHNESTTVM